MTNVKKKIKTILIIVTSLTAALFLTLVIHIAVMIKSRPPLVDATIQMARVDFHAALSTQQQAVVEGNVMKESGTRSVFYNPKTEILIYTFDNQLNNADKIYQNAVKPIAPISTRVTVSSKEVANGCPAFDNHSFYGKLTAIVSRFM